MGLTIPIDQMPSPDMGRLLARDGIEFARVITPGGFDPLYEVLREDGLMGIDGVFIRQFNEEGVKVPNVKIIRRNKLAADRFAPLLGDTTVHQVIDTCQSRSGTSVFKPRYLRFETEEPNVLDDGRVFLNFAAVTSTNKSLRHEGYILLDAVGSACNHRDLIKFRLANFMMGFAVINLGKGREEQNIKVAQRIVRLVRRPLRSAAEFSKVSYEPTNRGRAAA